MCAWAAALHMVSWAAAPFPTSGPLPQGGLLGPLPRFSPMGRCPGWYPPCALQGGVPFPYQVLWLGFSLLFSRPGRVGADPATGVHSPPPYKKRGLPLCAHAHPVHVQRAPCTLEAPPKYILVLVLVLVRVLVLVLVLVLVFVLVPVFVLVRFLFCSFSITFGTPRPSPSGQAYKTMI